MVTQRPSGVKRRSVRAVLGEQELGWGQGADSVARHNKKKVTGQCAYCKTVGTLTPDHVVPQCLFGGRVPPDIPVVPACDDCNHRKKSRVDTYLQHTLLCDLDTYNHPTARKLFDGAFARALNRNQSWLARHVRTRLRPVEMVTPSGLFAGIAYEAPLPHGQVTDVLSMMVRGLHPHYTGDRLPEDIAWTVHRVRNVPDAQQIVQVAVALGQLRYQPVGDSTIFNCIFGVEPGDPALSLWWLSFYSSPVSPGAIYHVTSRAAR
jgi:HNH endonuclease